MDTNTNRGELPITNLKAVITYAGAQRKAYAEADTNGDGKRDGTEIAAFAAQMLMQGFSRYGNVVAAFPEALDIRGPEPLELIDHVIATEWLPDDRNEAEVFVDQLLGYAKLIWQGSAGIYSLVTERKQDETVNLDEA